MRWMHGTCVEVSTPTDSPPWTMLHDVRRHPHVVHSMMQASNTLQQVLQQVHTYVVILLLLWVGVVVFLCWYMSTWFFSNSNT